MNEGVKFSFITLRRICKLYKGQLSSFAITRASVSRAIAVGLYALSRRVYARGGDFNADGREGVRSIYIMHRRGTKESVTYLSVRYRRHRRRQGARASKEQTGFVGHAMAPTRQRFILELAVFPIWLAGRRWEGGSLQTVGPL